MKHPNSFQTTCSFLILLTFFLLLPDRSIADVCSDGTGIPPFLASGGKANLLLVLDNSGSMLDLAYVDTIGECTDGSFYTDLQTNSDKTYAGLFDNTKWYEWKPIDGATGGFFEEVIYSTSAEAESSFGVGAGETAYTYPDYVFVKFTETTEVIDGKTVTTQTGVTGFAASGNFLNWASASKFDIQKEILTGGKYEQDQYNQDVLISEGRGCSASPFVKEVPIKFPVTFDGEGNITSKVLTFSIRGFEVDDSELSGYKTEDITHIAIMGISDGGFIGSTNNEYCQLVIDEYAKGSENFIDCEELTIDCEGLTVTECEELTAAECEAEEVDTGKTSLGRLQQYIEACLDYSEENNVLAESNAAYNHSIQKCWFSDKKDYSYDDFINHTNVSSVQNACQNIYYNGVYPVAISPYNSGYMCYGDYNSTPPEPAGYLGRCWVPGSVPNGCLVETCTGEDDPSQEDGTGDKVRCFNGTRFQCLASYNRPQDICSQGNNKDAWTPVLIDVDPANNSCPDNSVGTPGQWTTTDTDQCLKDALWDYCGYLKVGEVIDATDNLHNTGETWGMVGALIDAGIVSMFGTETPLIVMKGHIKQDSPPTGIIHDVADKLRIGVMAFNPNGADYECDLGNSPADTIVRHCPATNYDGAEVIAQIKDDDAETPTTENPEKKHIDDLVLAINSEEANAWTPLAEALYNALGYYGQNENYRLNDHDFTTADDADQSDPPWEDPVQTECQDNFILIITEGASTTDINPDVAFAATNITVEGYTPTTEGECKSGGLNNGNSELYSSTYLDNMTFLGLNAVEAGIFTTSMLDGENKENITTYFVGTGISRDDTTTTDQCNPAVLLENAAEQEDGSSTLYGGEDPATLETDLRNALFSILNRSSSGSTASVIANSRSGEGGVYQAIFWADILRGLDEDPLTWVGDVHAFFIDENGWFWDDYSGLDGKFGELSSEDTDGNGILTEELDENGDIIYPEDKNDNGHLDGDRRIRTFYNSDTNVNKTQICFSFDDDGNCQQSQYYPGDIPLSIDIRDFDNYLWSAKDQLLDRNLDSIELNRSLLSDGKWDFSQRRRYIFTWNDLNNDGIVDYEGPDSNDDGIADYSEIIAVEPGMNKLIYSEVTTASDRASLLADFNVQTDDELDPLIRWVRGDDSYYEDDTDGNDIFEPFEDINGNGIQDYVYRCRKYPDCPPPALDNDTDTWRLGDVIHSAPTLVSRPAERYHFPYKDREYGAFYKQYLSRRHVVYFGANDGMLHAVNGGFYQAGLNKFSTCLDNPGATSPLPHECQSGGSYADLGEELWAYIPYNLQPHLSCLSDPSYVHKYFVDGTPRIFDVRIFPDDADHPAGWGTILVGYMRFGGAETLAGDSASPTDNRKFISAYFILDITNPEKPPVLIGEMTMTTDDDDDDPTTDDLIYTGLGYTTSMPTVVPMRDDSGNSEWFLVLGNGPTTMEGENDQEGKVAIVPLNSLTGVNWKTNGKGDYDPATRQPFRIPNTPLTSSSDDADLGIKLIPPDSNGDSKSFVGDMVSVDYDLDAKSIPDIGIPYKTDVVYFGTVDGSEFDSTVQGWNGDGRLFRLLTNPGHEYTDGEQNYTYPGSWELSLLIDAQGPITAAPNIAYDGDNFWVYFGTGRFYSEEDKPDNSMQYFFGIKEPRNSTCDNFTWDKINWWDVDNNTPKDTFPGLAPGEQGLLRTDPIRVLESATSSFTTGDYVFCEEDGGSSCSLPLTPRDPAGNGEIYYLFSDLVHYIKGERCGTTPDLTNGIDGWYRQFNGEGERSLGMPILLGGLVTFTGYEPGDVCKAEGESDLYGVYYLTGTAWYEKVFGTYQNGGMEIVRDRLDLGKGLTMTPSLQAGGSPNGPDATAYIQTSTGEIIEVPQENLPIQNFKSGRTSWRNE